MSILKHAGHLSHEHAQLMLCRGVQGFQDDAQLEDRVWKDFVRVTDLHQEQHLPTVDLDLIRNTFFTFYKATLEFGIRTFPELRSEGSCAMQLLHSLEHAGERDMCDLACRVLL